MNKLKFKTVKHKLTQAVRHFSGCLAMRETDIVLASFPRSGSTWFRTIFASCINLSSGLQDQTQMKDLDSVMPVLGYSTLGKGGSDFYQPRLIKTHRLASEIKPFRPQQVLHLWREPKAVMKSCFRYYSAHREYQIADLSAMVHHKKLGMPAWEKHCRDWQPIASVNLEYNLMREHTAREVSRVLAEMGYDELVPFVGDAVELANLKNMKSSEEKGIRNPERFEGGFSSIGGSVSDETEFSPSDLEYIEGIASKVLSK